MSSRRKERHITDGDTPTPPHISKQGRTEATTTASNAAPVDDTLSKQIRKRTLSRKQLDANNSENTNVLQVTAKKKSASKKTKVINSTNTTTTTNSDTSKEEQKKGGKRMRLPEEDGGGGKKITSTGDSNKAKKKKEIAAAKKTTTNEENDMCATATASKAKAKAKETVKPFVANDPLLTTTMPAPKQTTTLGTQNTLGGGEVSQSITIDLTEVLREIMLHTK